MISSRNVPVLIDFGFAEQYDATAKDPFLSNLHYGTPEVSGVTVQICISAC
jgi:serine/threonine-protein kinase GIN4